MPTVFENKLSRLLFFIILAILCKIHTPSAFAQQSSDGIINYSYASWIGTGYYRIEDRTIWILRSPITSYTLREAEGKKWGIELLFPITLGYDQIESANEDIGSISFVPGVSFAYKVIENWQLKPYGQIGVGTDFNRGDTNLIWGYGIKSLASFSLNTSVIELGNSLRFADHSDSGKGGDNGFSMWEIGLNYRTPVGFNLFERQNSMSFYTIYKGFMNELEFVNVLDENTSINRLITFGVVLGVESPIKILGIPFSGGGITYTYGDGFSGIGFTTGFPF